MAADLTPELLAQLEQDIASLTRHGEVRTSWAGNEVEAASGWLHVCDAPHKTACKLARLINAAPALVAAAKERDQLRRQIERIAGTSLGGMCREVAQLREMLENQRGTISKLREEIAERDSDESEELAVCSKQLDMYVEERRGILAESNRLCAEVERLRGENDLWMRDRDEATAERDTARQLADKREEERDALQAEVERLRGLGLEAVGLLEKAGRGWPKFPPLSDRCHDLRAEIERKP